MASLENRVAKMKRHENIYTGMLKADGKIYAIRGKLFNAGADLTITLRLVEEYQQTKPLTRWGRIRRALRRISYRVKGLARITQNAQQGKTASNGRAGEVR